MKLNTLPESLRQSGLFCCWRYEERNGQTTKVPYHPITGQMAKSNVRESFTPFSAALTAAPNYSGIGIGIFNGICAIDLDDCVTDSGCFTPIAAEIVALIHSYTEYSPSGNGLHILFQADHFPYDKSRYYIMNHKIGLEVYVAGATNKYVTITGNSYGQYPFGDRSSELSALLETYMLRSSSAGSGTNGINGANSINAAIPDEQLLDQMKHSANQAAFSRLWSGIQADYPSHSEADLALCQHLAFWTGCNAAQMDRLFRRSGLMREKWNRSQAHSTYGALTIQKAINGCSQVYTPRSKKTSSLFSPLTPLNAREQQLPPFPVSCLPEVLSTYVQAVAAHSQTSPDMASTIGLGVLATCLQGKFMVQGTPGYFEPLSLYTVDIAPPGERKSGVMRDMTQYLYEYEAELNRSREPELRTNRQQREHLTRKITALQKKLERCEDTKLDLQLQDLENQLDDLPNLKPLRFFADDCSSEALVSLLANNGGVFSVISTEGGIFDIMAGRYSNKINIDVWLKGHCGDAIRVDRLGREPEYIPHPALSAILTIQPSVLDEIMSNTNMTGRGLMARFLFSSPPSRIGSRVFCAPPIPAETAQAYRTFLFQLMNLPRTDSPHILNLSERATEVIADHFSVHEQFLVGEGQDISDWASKYIGTVLRIAGLLHAAEHLDNKVEITAQTMHRAIQIGGYFLAHSSYAYSVMGTDLSIRKAAFVLNKLKKEQIREMKRNALFRICRGKFFKKADDICDTLELLQRDGYIRLEQPERTGPGRPSDYVVFVNPAVHKTK